MSVDYYLVCQEKKMVMPFFSMSLGGLFVADKNWIFEFIFDAGQEPISVIHEDSDDMPDFHDNKSWEFINAWHPYK